MIDSSRPIWFLALVLTAALTAAAQAQTPAWKPVEGHIMTRWAKDVTPEKVWPEYPRPTMVREKWMSLNGLWAYSIVKGEPKDSDAAAGSILVPFPPESALSGLGRIVQPDDTLSYWRTFRIPDDWKDQRVLLHFGAVDWHAVVTVNGKQVGEHTGGYDPFSLDITDALRSGENQIRVRVRDGTDQSGQPRGKQWLTPHGIWYTPTSGIWQTVWLEPVPQYHIDRVFLVQDGFNPHSPFGGAVRAPALVVESLAPPGYGLRFDVKESIWKRNGEELKTGGSSFETREPGRLPPARLPVDSMVGAQRLWTPDDPFLYDAKLELIDEAAKAVDSVRISFGLRDIRVAKDDHGINRLMLNGKPIFMSGPLDQGFWPDGIYTPPTDEAMRFDIEAVKKMGDNMLRKHVKVEPERFYYWCDKLGVMVWQDMPSPFFAAKGWNEKLPELTDQWKENFDSELHRMIEARRGHPSIVMWVPFNEGWGQNDLTWAKGEVEKVKQWDPTRLVNCSSGWTDTGNGDVHDVHDYPGPGMAPVESSRASVLGEYGGLGLPLEGHTWVAKNNWGYVSYKNKEDLTDAYVGLIRQLPLLIGRGLCAAVYTQTTDCEIECNGWLTYDREVWKIDPDKAAAAAKALYLPPPAVKVVVTHAGEGSGAKWKYTTEKPADAWFETAFDDSQWKEGAAGFGTRGTPGAVIGTEWNTDDIWIRRTVELDSSKMEFPNLAIHHDEDAEVYINGEPAAKLSGYTTSYQIVPLSDAAARLLKPGGNTIAIHCHQTTGGQYIDCGIVDVRAAK